MGCQPSERIGVESDQRRCQNLRQRQIVDRAPHKGEQRPQIIAFEGLEQTAAAIRLDRQPGFAQGALIGLESGARAGEHENFAVWHGLALTGQDLAGGLDGVCNLHAFVMAQRGLVITRRHQPVEGLVRVGGGGVVGLDQRQPPEDAIACGRKCCLMAVVGHHRWQTAVEYLDDRRRIAPRGVGANLERVEAFLKKAGRCQEDPRLGAPEPIDRLTRIADHKDRGPIAGTGIGLQPVGEQAPLQAAGVLKLIEEQMPIAPVEAALDIGCRTRIAHQAIGAGFEIGEIDDTTGALDLPVDHHQFGATAHHGGVERQARPLSQQLAGCQDAFGKLDPASLQRGFVFAQAPCRLSREMITKRDGGLPVAGLLRTFRDQTVVQCVEPVAHRGQAIGVVDHRRVDRRIVDHRLALHRQGWRGGKHRSEIGRHLAQRGTAAIEHTNKTPDLASQTGIGSHRLQQVGVRFDLGATRRRSGRPQPSQV